MIYSAVLWVIALPCLTYLGSFGTYPSPPRTVVAPLTSAVSQVATGILTIYSIWNRLTDNSAWPTIAYFSTSLSLSVLLTLIVVIRLVLHGRTVRAATVFPAGISGLY